ncbi:MAG TPA: hypothetical protein VJ992_05175 [Gemmatimonadales bacterium]|nr:hypothetical protein [Gemmatimonadales bacterium]
MLAGTYAATETAVIALQHGSWWTTPRSSFHFGWGGSASAEQDLLVHAAIGYQVSQIGAIAFDWACLAPQTAGWLGAALGLAFELPKEIGDGLHQGEGFAGDDMLAASTGALLPALHRSVPATRMLGLKVFYWPSAEYLNRTGPLPQLESDYAGQRYFLAIDPGRLPHGAGPWPDWLGIAIGHGTDHWATIPPDHVWYATLDLNLRGIPIHTRWWHTIATLVDQVKIPLPGLKLVDGTVHAGVY